MTIGPPDSSGAHNLAVIEFSAWEREAKALYASTVMRAARLFAADGCLLIKDLFSPRYIHQLYQGYVKQMKQRAERDPIQQVKGSWVNGMLVAGDQRLKIPVEFCSPFDRPELYANPLLLPIIQLILGPECVIGSLGSVLSFPGAQDQHIHRDHPPLFEVEQVDDPLPCYGLTVVIPLVNVTKTTGTTRVWKGSHRFTRKTADWITSNLHHQDPLIPVGCCLLMDYRLMHQGQANLSKDQIRPILSNVYTRPWFRDYGNYSDQLPIQISSEAYEAVPEQYKHLFSWANLYRLVREYDATLERDPRRPNPAIVTGSDYLL